MDSILCLFDDKHVPLYRVIWVSETPHFCGDDQCTAEGRYELRLEQDDSLFGSREDRDRMLTALDNWRGGIVDDDRW